MHVLEPLTATVFNSLLAGRPFVAHTPVASSSALRIVSRSAHQKFPQDFFTPRPRRVKGKERARPGDAWDVCLNADECKTSLSTGRSSSRRARRMSNHKFMRTSAPSGTPWLSDSFQRRHSSSLLNPESSNNEPPDQDAWIDKIERFSTWIPEEAWWKGDIDYEEVWNAYESLQKADRCDGLPIALLMNMASHIADFARDPTFGSQASDSIPLWGTRLLVLLDSLSHRIPPAGLHLRWKLLEARGLAMQGQFEEAAGMVRSLTDVAIETNEKSWVVLAYITLLSRLRRLRHPIVGFEMLLAEWEGMQPYLQERTIVWGNVDLRRSVAELKQLVHSVVIAIENMAAFMVTAQQKWPPERQRSIGEFLTRTLCRVELPEDALAMQDMLLEQGISVPVDVQLLVTKSLAKDDKFQAANKLFTSLSKSTGSAMYFRKYQSLGLYLCAHEGDITRSEEYFDRLAQREWVTLEDINMLMHAYARRGDTDRVVELFHHFFPSGANVKGRPKPTIFQYTTVIYAHAQRADYDGINTWVELMTEAGISPDLYVYSIILHSLAMRGDLSSMVELLDQMHNGNLQPDAAIYTTIISLLATRRDPVAAEEIYKRAIGEGVVPDRRMVTSLMNAHVEAGHWAGVIRVFDYLSSSASRGLRLTIEVFNTLLKAYVLIGAPFRIVASLFQRLGKARARPDGHTFALLIQSACDSGLMGIATDLVGEMERMAESWDTNIQLNVYVFTILMAGHLRRGHKARARAVYETMKARGIEPSAATYGAIINAYAHEKTGEGLKIAEDFLHSLMSTKADQRPWLKPVGGPMLPLETVYAPIMIGHTWREDPEVVERLYQEMLDNGGEPTLGTLTALFDAYRRKGDLAAMRRTWPQIVELGLRYARISGLFNGMADEVKPNLRSHGTAMCIPLSIYIDALSAAGVHSEIPPVWTMLRNEGLAFDSHNWNHLAVALVRAGEPERAFEVIERVIIPYRERSREISEARDTKVESPLTDRLPPDEEEDELPPAPSESPMHFAKRRAETVELVREKSRGLEDEAVGDFAHQLNALRQVSPLWNVWRPHLATLVVLMDVLIHLEQGLLIQPVRPGDDEDEQVALDLQALEARRATAQEILHRIHTNYPRAVRMVREYDLVRRSSWLKQRRRSRR